MYRLALLAVLIVSPALHATESNLRKCAPQIGSILLRDTYQFVVDGELQGEYPIAASTEIPPPVMPPAEEVQMIDVVCWEWVDASTGERVRQSVVAIVTKAAAVRVMEDQLHELVAAQEEYFASRGHYARNLTELGFFSARTRLPIQMVMVERGWSASVELDGLPQTCRVSVSAEASEATTVPTCALR